MTLPVWLSVCLCVCVSVCLSVCLSLSLPVSVSVPVSVSPILSLETLERSFRYTSMPLYHEQGPNQIACARLRARAGGGLETRIQAGPAGFRFLGAPDSETRIQSLD